jgi:hypothetical protein
VLVQFALIVFALLGLLSLIIDVGYARLTQAQMQQAADSAALEGLRQRNVGVVDPATGLVVDDPFASDCLRRVAANRVVRWTFDDDFDEASGDAYQYGAGPVLDLTGGTGSLHAFDTVRVPEGAATYDPDPQLNQQNAVYGDMVSGRYCYSADPRASEGLAHADTDSLVCEEPQRGEGMYARNDFNPSPASPAPPAGLPSCPAPDQEAPDPWPLPSSGSLNGDDDSAFLVRLRRSNELGEFGVQTEPDVASSGPSLPLIFARGTLLRGDDPASAYSPRRDGLTVRATAIARTRPALHVGLPQANPARPGVTPFALRDAFVQGVTAAGVPATINPANGLLCPGTTCAGVVLATSAGRYVDNLNDADRTSWTAISTVGQAVPAPVPVACAAAATFSGFGPVYSLLASGTNRIIGFTRVGIRRDPARPLAPCAVLVSRSPSVVAPANATAVLSGGLPLPTTAEPAEVAELMDRHFERNGSASYSPVLVAVLAR